MKLRIFPWAPGVAAGGCRFGNRVATSAPASGAARTRETAVETHAHVFIVVQKGRSFQRANPRARVLVDAGRFLVVDWPEPDVWVEEPGCFAVVPYEDGAIDFGVRMAAPARRRDEILDLVNGVSAADLRTSVEELAAIHTRESVGPGYLQALDICEAQLNAARCTTSRQSFLMPGGESFNLIGERPGRADDRRLYIISGHLDSVNHEGGGGARAPGADDNASGTVAVLHAAKALARLDVIEHDVRFVLFGGEEQGLFGSKHFVSQLSDRDRGRIGGVVNIDMAASKNTPVPTVLLEAAPLSQAVVDQLAAAAAAYTSLETQVSLDPFASDHVPFIDEDLPAVLTIEGSDDAYAHEHTARDVPANLDFELHRQIVMMDVAWLATAVAPPR